MLLPGAEAVELIHKYGRWAELTCLSKDLAYGAFSFANKFTPQLSYFGTEHGAFAFARDGMHHQVLAVSRRTKKQRAPGKACSKTAGVVLWPSHQSYQSCT
jgi:hypothetical protein